MSTDIAKKSLRLKFPNLTDNNFDVTSPRTSSYNCIGWAAGEDSRWWWPDQMRQYYWPSSVERKPTIPNFIEAFKLLGYEVCENGVLEQGFEKVAIYVDTRSVPTHMARQLDNGNWTSKLGQSFDIRHDAPDNLDGDNYGATAVYMKKRIDSPSV